MKREYIPRILLMTAISFLDIITAATFIYYYKAQGILLSAKEASKNLPEVFLQNVITSLFAILVFVVTVCILKKQFTEKMYLRVTNKKQIIPVVILAVLAIVLLVAALIWKEDRITVLYLFFYYFFFIAFFEEFIFRGVCLYLANSFPTIWRYLIPNMLFALMHIFSYANWSALTPEYIVSFLTGNVLGLLGMGCLFQFIKEKTETLWTAILLHAILDFMIVF